MALSRFLKAAPPVLSLLVVLAFVILNALGIWQWQRLHWKQQLMAQLEQTQSVPPVELTALLAEREPAWRAVILPPCPVSPQSLLHMHSAVEGKAGHRILMACPTGDQAILVDLGFVAEGNRLDISNSLPSDIRLTGRMRPFEAQGAAPGNSPEQNDWYWRDSVAMGTAMGTSLRTDYFVVADLAQSDIRADGLVQGALTAPLSNRHLEYALTWFALALTLVAVYGALVLQRMRKA